MQYITVKFKSNDEVLRIPDEMDEYNDDKLDAFLKYGNPSEEINGYVLYKQNISNMTIEKVEAINND